MNPLLQQVVSDRPADRLVRQTARSQWKLLALNLASTLSGSALEGMSLGVVFLAVQLLTSADAATSSSLLRWWPVGAAWIERLTATEAFFGLLLVAVLLQVVQAFTKFVTSVSAGYFAARCRVLATNTVFQRILSLSFSCASGYRVGDLLSFMSQASNAITYQINSLNNLLSIGCLCVAYLIVLVIISPWLLLAVALMVGTIGLIQKRLLPRIMAGSVRLTTEEVAVSSRITEDLQGLRLLHSSGQLDASGQRVQRMMAVLEQVLRGQVRRMSVVGPVSSMLPIVAIAAIAALSLLIFRKQTNGVLPSLVTFVIALQRLNMRLEGLAGVWNSFAANSADLNRLNTILTTEDKQFRRVGGITFSGLERELRLEAVGLRYAPELPPALADVCFTLPKGQMLALVGPSGAGKSSIADLLTGLYAPGNGQIWIDDTPLEQLDLASWQQRLGVVSQDTFLFNATIAENIAFGTPGATPAQIQAACQAAQAAGFIESLPQGYDTLVGERGYRLSGGQRQRLSLARAILRDPELLILDEATSALDSQSERLVQEAIERFERNHTVLVIAHRLSTIVRADQILVLDAGRVVERGNHTSLLAHGGLYSQLWAQQSQGAQQASEPALS